MTKQESDRRLSSAVHSYGTWCQSGVRVFFSLSSGRVRRCHSDTVHTFSFFPHLSSFISRSPELLGPLSFATRCVAVQGAYARGIPPGVI